jgi:hypothetical protein
MPLVYTLHAHQQMAVRGVTEAEVEDTIACFEVRYPDVKGNACYLRRIGGRDLRIVLNERLAPPGVITVIVL